MPISEENRLKLDGVVQRMEASGENEATIRQAVDEFKTKYSQPDSETPADLPANKAPAAVSESELIGKVADRFQRVKEAVQKPEGVLYNKGAGPVEKTVQLPLNAAFMVAGEAGGVPVDVAEAVVKKIPAKVRQNVFEGLAKGLGFGQAVKDAKAGTGFFKKSPKLTTEEARALEYLGNIIAAPANLKLAGTAAKGVNKGYLAINPDAEDILSGLAEDWQSAKRFR